jgi:hypothetical protein
VGRGLFLKAMNCEFPPPRAADVSTTHKRRLILPPNAPGMRIGLFGGTFDPPHAAHRGACLLAMKRIGLDRVWWMVTPGNPLKDGHGLAPLAARVVAAKALADDPRIDVTDFEAQPCPDRRGRPAWSEPLRLGRRGRSGTRLCASPRDCGKDAAGTKASGVDLSAWPQIAAVVDRAAGGTGLAGQLTEGI